MPAATQLRSCPMRSGVQVAEVVMLFGLVAIGAGAIGKVALASIAVTGRSVDGIGSDGAIDESVMRRPRYCRGRSGPPTGQWPRTTGNRETNKTSKRKSVRAL